MSTRLLTVDAAGTLVRPWPSVGAVYGRTAREHGIEVSDEAVNTKFYKTFGRLQTCKQTNEGEESEFWRQVVTQTFRPFAGNKNLDPLFEELWNLFAKGECWKLAEKAESTLNTLRVRGYELAVLSNNDARLRSVLADLKIDQAFDHLFISSEMGCEKPELEIFRKVEQTMNRKPNEILHLGDSHSRDFLGARKAGWSALLYGEPKLENEQISCFSELLNYLP
ncbi:HAD-IA family hydrolase [Opitutales bacterium]|nr:HAD-IA family hydrolase [Opitutales bacterium]